MKTIVITGASRGLGLALAKEFSANGWHVVGVGRSVKPAELPESAAYQQFDASDVKACDAFWRQLQSKQPDAQICLVNNAGGYVSGGLLETSPEDYDQQMKSCYFSSVYMTRGLASVFPRARVVNIISSSALAPHEANPAYGSAKAAQMHFFQSLQHEFTPAEYQITNLYPENIATHGANPEAIDPIDLAAFVRQQAENKATYYLRDVSIYPTGPKQ